MSSPPGPEITIDGSRYLYFGGSSYLGLAAHPEVIEAGCRGMREFGIASGTARAGFGTSPAVQEVERQAAEYFGTGHAFYVSSGYVAPQVMIAALAEEGDVVLLDESAHYSSQDAARLSGLPVFKFPAQAPDVLGVVAQRHRRVLVVTDAFGPVTGQAAPVLDYLRVLQSLERATLILDDAHGFGVLGPQGRGLLDELSLWPQFIQGASSTGTRLAVCGTLSKAFGAFGGIIPGEREVVSRAHRGSHHFDGATAPPSGTAAATAKALEIAAREPFRRQRVREHSTRLRARLRAMGVPVPDSPAAHFGLSIGDAANMRRIHSTLKAGGILLPYIKAYPGIPAEGALRFAVFADHTTEQVDRLIDELRKTL
ncbi:MAG: aminotransferase class I/II-fold pyridoxal phosphate-dependent enzyme [Verrucomicrobiia bacterium]